MHILPCKSGICLWGLFTHFCLWSISPLTCQQEIQTRSQWVAFILTFLFPVISETFLWWGACNAQWNNPDKLNSKSSAMSWSFSELCFQSRIQALCHSATSVVTVGATFHSGSPRVFYSHLLLCRQYAVKHEDVGITSVTWGAFGKE